MGVHIMCAALLSRMRLGSEHLTDGDWALLESRVCGHGHNKCKKKCCKYQDIVLPRRSKKRQLNGARRASDEVIINLYPSLSPFSMNCFEYQVFPRMKNSLSSNDSNSM